VSHIDQTNVVIVVAAIVAVHVCKIVILNFAVDLSSRVVCRQNQLITTRRIGIIGGVRCGIVFVVYKFQIVVIDQLRLLTLCICVSIKKTLVTSAVVVVVIIVCSG